MRPRAAGAAPIFGGPTMDPTVPASLHALSPVDLPDRLPVAAPQRRGRWPVQSHSATPHSSPPPPMVPAKSDVPLIDLDVWERCGRSGAGQARRHPGAGADPLAVYRAPWHTSRAATAPATEIDLAETVVPPTTAGTTWVVFRNGRASTSYCTTATVGPCPRTGPGRSSCGGRRPRRRRSWRPIRRLPSAGSSRLSPGPAPIRRHRRAGDGTSPAAAAA